MMRFLIVFTSFEYAWKLCEMLPAVSSGSGGEGVVLIAQEVEEGRRGGAGGSGRKLLLG